MIILLCVAYAIIFFILMLNSFDESYKRSGCLETFFVASAILSGFAFMAALVFFIFFLGSFIVVNVDSLVKLDRTKIEENRKAIVYCIEHGGNNVTLANDISSFNAEVINKRMLLHSFWFKSVTYDFWDDIELIDVEV